MENLIRKIDSMIYKKKYPWKRKGTNLTVELGETGRKQRIKFRRRGDVYIISSVVIRNNAIESKKDRRTLAYRAWRKNSTKDFVAFSFDEKDNLSGIIVQPVLTLNDEELVLYIDVLAKECDRFEYILTGDDRE